MAVSTLARQGEDKVIRQAYERRQDDIFYNTMHIIRADKAEREIKQARVQIEQEKRKKEEAERRAKQAEAENEKLRQELAKLKKQPTEQLKNDVAKQAKLIEKL